MTQEVPVQDAVAQSRELLLRALTSAEVFLVAAERQLPEIAEALETGRADDVRESLTLLLDGLSSLAQLARDLSTLERDRFDAEEALSLQAVVGVLRELIAAQERGDGSAMAEALRTGIAPHLASWRGVFVGCREFVRV